MTSQPSLFDIPPKEPSFDGRTFEPKLDQERLKGQLGEVRNLLRDGKWHTLREIATFARGSEAGVSARLRDLRKEKFGSHTIERRRLSLDAAGVWEYRMVV